MFLDLLQSSALQSLQYACFLFSIQRQQPTPLCSSQWQSPFSKNIFGEGHHSVPQKSICGSDVVLPQCHCMKRHFVANWSKTVEAEKICAKRQKLPVIVTKLLPAGLADAINPLCIALMAGWWLTTKSKCVRGTKQRSSWVGELYVGSEPLLKSTFSC